MEEHCGYVTPFGSGKCQRVETTLTKGQASFPGLPSQGVLSLLSCDFLTVVAVAVPCACLVRICNLVSHKGKACAQDRHPRPRAAALVGAALVPPNIQRLWTDLVFGRESARFMSPPS